MTAFHDSLGNHYSAASASDLTKLYAAIDAWLGVRANVMEVLQPALDAEIPIARCLHAHIVKSAANPHFAPVVERGLADLQSRAGTLTDQERRHIEALESVARDDSTRALEQLEALLAAYPRDMIALRVAHMLHFYSGFADNMRESTARALARWRDDDAFFGYLNGMHAFGCEEAGRLGEARERALRALEQNSADVWAAHANVHVYQSKIDFNGGIEFIESRTGCFEGVSNYANHLDWHKAVFHFGAGDFGAALAIYDECLEAPNADEFYLDACNAASLLWRLETKGIDVGERWRRLFEATRHRVHDQDLVFSSLHYLMAPARLDTDTDEILVRFTAWRQTDTSQGRVCAAVGHTLANALVVLGRGQYDEARLLFDRALPETYRIGGSIEQRALFVLLRDYAARMAA